MSGLPLGVCRKCGRRILWIVTDNDAKMPVDADPNPAGNVFIRLTAGVVHGKVASKAEPRPPGVAFMPHFATCPAQSRKGRQGAGIHRPPKPPPPEPPPALL